MTNAIRWDVLERAALSSLVRNLTVQELNALADFMESPHGRSAMKKMGAYTADVMPIVQQELIRAMQQMESANR
jgi:hypothetical protein